MPPTDPRILAMTDEQIDLEYAHLALDKKLKDGTEQYADDEFEKYDEETDSMDNRMSDLPKFDTQSADIHAHEEIAVPPASGKADKDEWEDVETNDFEAFYNNTED